MKHQDIISKMTLEEKAAILSGGGEWVSRDVKRLGLEHFVMSDGPHGVRRQAGAGDHLGLNASLPATCFPPASAIANSWDEQLGEEVGQALGEEAGALGVDVLLGPGLNMKRSPLCGRNFEYFAEDPVLAGRMAASYIRGIQSRNVYACPKHFAVNSQELRRMAMDAVVDERTLREIYLTGFEIAVKEGQPRTIMSAYNEVNGVYANENSHLLKEILRDDWGFDGIVISDWGASNDHVEGVRNGADLEMPGCGYDSTREVVQAVKKGKLSEKDLDERVDCMLDAMLDLKEKRAKRKAGAAAAGSGAKSNAGQNKTAAAAKQGSAAAGTSTKTGADLAAGAAGLTFEGDPNLFDYAAHHALARRAAEESAVLLKNDGSILPLKKGTKVAVIGDFAFRPRYQGAGSSLVNPTRVDSYEDAFKNCGEVELLGMEKGYDRNGKTDETLKNQAVELAKRAEAVLYFFGLNEISESEGGDRTHMKIPQNQIDLLKALAAVNPNIVGVLSAGSPIEMPWESSCKGILHTYLSGQAGAGAVVDLLTGKINPSGKLNETYPLTYQDTPAIRDYPSKERVSLYREAVYIGYRYYDTAGVNVRYPFGYGLSYTTFAYSDLTVSKDGVRLKVKNTGKMDGAEIAQLYVGKADREKSLVFRPKKELKGFCKVFLKAGEEKEVFLPFDERTFRYFNVKTDRFEIEGGRYEVSVGASSADIRLSGSIEVAGTKAPAPYDRERLKDYYSCSLKEISDDEFGTLLGRPVPDGGWSGKLRPNDTFAQLYYARSLTGRLVYLILNTLKKNSEKKGVPNLNVMFIFNMPFRAMAKMTGGSVNKMMATGIRNVFNHLIIIGLGKIIVGFMQNLCVNAYYSAKLKK